MSHSAKRFLIFYILFFAIFFILALYGEFNYTHGEHGISAHIWLTLTGLPLSFGSWLLPHGSLAAVFVAGLLGVFQWYFVIKMMVFLGSRKFSKKP